MTSSQNTAPAAPDSGEAQNQAQGPGVPRNVSFANGSNKSTAYREHNPPTVLRRQVAAHREMSPSRDPPSQEDQKAAPMFYIGGAPGAGPDLNSRQRGPLSAKPPAVDAQHPTRKADAPPAAPVFTPGAGKQPSQTAPTFSVVPPQATSQRESTPAPEHGASTRKVSGPQKIMSAGPTPSSSSMKLHHQQAAEGDSKQDEVHILVGVSGSVATIKLPQIVHKLKQIYRKRAVIQVVVTRAATTFFDPLDLPKDIKVWQDSDEWRSRQATEGPEFGAHCDQQLHIRLRRWADILLVAPCSANTLAKITYGICDNLLTSIFRVWNPDVPILLAPAMNTHMYTNPVTKLHFNVLKESYPFVEILKPVEKVLVCGDIGMGGMREWTEIVQILVKRIGVDLPEDEDEDDSDDDTEGGSE